MSDTDGFIDIGDDRLESDDVCNLCGGERFVALSDCPELWGEDCFSEIDRLVRCPECKGEGRQ